MKPKTPTIRLVIDDHVDFATTKLPSLVLRIIKRLGDLQDGRLLTSMALSSQLGVGPSHLKDTASHPSLADYRILHQGRMLYGSLATIKEARRQLAS